MHPSALSRSDFDNSAWLYLFVGGTVVVGAGDFGVKFLVDGRATVESVLKSLVKSPAGWALPGTREYHIAKAIWEGTKAWCPYYGTAASLGLQVGAMARGIGMVKISDRTF